MTEDQNAPLDTRRKRVLYRANHRGTYENDLMIGGFVRARIVAMSEQELDEIEAVMEFPDAELADWLTGRKPIPEHADSPMLRRIREAALARGDGGAKAAKVPTLRSDVGKPPEGAALENKDHI
ncbi:MAG: succinate dehydrogenase assembly factor 2 [Rhodospirillales bacterium]|nr:succinate dehydrogenase assembly factor 2 [Rhodospirillales bacterium]